MEKFTIRAQARTSLPGRGKQAIVGVVASGNLEILLERTEPDQTVVVDVVTSARGFQTVWEAVIADFVTRSSPGGVRFSIHDNGARPDTVMLRLMQGVNVLEKTA
ncbi:malonate decarboxylase acyl carrier protein [Acetobacter conturbans]|uniref:Malonate decarboxylase acyl carrier protein n=1 Tax=Acetobacter conturbans TaxID=1737472 RepID=A0ABX0K8N5_9PROT|nr:malonate decarboxylase acyl carrier protein [Acetobacter conturbans]NHN89754.1 malonate decarboxylase acyl carrier protein [Acetobacter conturbans]